MSIGEEANFEAAREVLRLRFGHKEFRNQQGEAIECLLEGKDAFVLMPTGGGKSLCYQIPSLLRAGCGVVVSPLIALMQDQVQALLQLGVRAAFLNSSLGYGEQLAVEERFMKGELDLLYVAPERLLTERMLGLLERAQVALFAIDEAHCVSQWGHDFRKEYQRLEVLHRRFPSVPRIALTATADARTRTEILEQLDLAEAGVFINSFDRPNIRYEISEADGAREQLWRFLRERHVEDSGIVYCLSRKGTEQVAEWLQKKGRNALAYHAGLPSEVRSERQERFLREEGVIIVATIAFGMGIDKPDVRFVAHLNLPKSLEAYYQETGRAGRDGAPASAWMAYGLQDVILLRQMAQDSDADAMHKRVMHQKLESMLGLCELTSCRRQALLAYFGETMEEPCGNCDNCLAPPETWDGTVAAQKALSTVYRTGQRYGVTYNIDVLLGKEGGRVFENGHDRLSTFGIGQELSAREWRGVFRQLIARGYLEVDHEGYGTLCLTEHCRPLLRSEESVEFRKLRKPSKRSRTHNPSKPRIPASLSPADQTLFESLRQLRSTIATEQKVPAYVIFHDATLEELAVARPKTRSELLDVPGIGEAKLDRYGDRVLALLNGDEELGAAG